MGIEENEALQDYFPDLKKGVVVNGIQPGTPAASSDLRAGDVILKVDNIPVSFSRDVQREIPARRWSKRDARTMAERQSVVADGEDP